MNNNLRHVMTEVYDRLSLDISMLRNCLEGSDYDACEFQLNARKIICRSSKITPKKVGQFVTFWKRNENGETEPYSDQDEFDFYVINVKHGKCYGQFVFPKSVLINKGYISTKEKDGKRGFRVYPIWDKVSSKQAERTQMWQKDYFYEINSSTDFEKVKQLYYTG